MVVLKLDKCAELITYLVGHQSVVHSEVGWCFVLLSVNLVARCHAV